MLTDARERNSLPRIPVSPVNTHRSRRSSVLMVLLVVLVTGTHWAIALPEPGAWQTGVKTPPFKEGVDRLFVVNRQWIEGRVKAIDESSVTINTGGEDLVLQREEVSLIELADWLDPTKRNQPKREIRLVIFIEGDSERGDLFFDRGTIIKEIHEAPSFVDGGDADDRASTTRTSISYDKGSKDRSVTTLKVDLTLIVGSQEGLTFEVHNNRSNMSAGSLIVKFVDGNSGKPIAELKKPISSMWAMCGIPAAKLKPMRNPTRLKHNEWRDVRSVKIQTIKPNVSSQPRKINKTRVVLIDHSMLAGKLKSLDEKNLAIQTKHVGPPMLVPRSQIAFVELHDWEKRWRASSLGKKERNRTTTKPIRLIFAGSSSMGSLTFSGRDGIYELISPPHYVTGRDFKDACSVNSNNALGFDKVNLDRSAFQVETIVVLKVEKKASLSARYANRYTNILAGDIRVMFLDVISGKPYWMSPKSQQRRQTLSFNIQRSRLIK